jgi:hypothetical protein
VSNPNAELSSSPAANPTTGKHLASTDGVKSFGTVEAAEANEEKSAILGRKPAQAGGSKFDVNKLFQMPAAATSSVSKPSTYVWIPRIDQTTISAPFPACRTASSRLRCTGKACADGSTRHRLLYVKCVFGASCRSCIRFFRKDSQRTDVTSDVQPKPEIADHRPSAAHQHEQLFGRTWTRNFPPRQHSDTSRSRASQPDGWRSYTRPALPCIRYAPWSATWWSSLPRHAIWSPGILCLRVLRT